MAAAGSLAWRHRFPARALRRLSWYLVAGCGAVAVVWLLFGAEPDRLGTGEANPLAALPRVAAALVALGSLPLAAALVRRPQLAADHYALRLRPGCLRTLLLPWATVSEITAVRVAGAPVLLVRCRQTGRPAADQPRWWDQSVLRAARATSRYDLAVRMDEFSGNPSEQLASLANWAPARITVVDDLARDRDGA